MAFLNLKNILLTKISNVQKMKYHMISFILNSGKGKAIGAEKRHIMVTWGRDWTQRAVRIFLR